MSWLSKVGIQGGKVKDLWGGRGFQKNSALGWIGYAYGIGSYQGASAGGQAAGWWGSQSRNAAQGTVSAQQTANANSREREIGKYEGAGHDIAPDYIKDPAASAKPIALPADDGSALLAAGQAEQQAALARQRRQRMVAGAAGRSGSFFLGAAPPNTGAKTLLGT